MEVQCGGSEGEGFSQDYKVKPGEDDRAAGAVRLMPPGWTWSWLLSEMGEL